ncbi:DNA adenine methylase [Leuconostoc pseudomesenteroides]|uniref:DNA adenine methylase n=2 Tax=root TaxID=1 RepID=A0ABT6HE86_LEUPS|nr:DNA adenine methylase [Leuconostoc pseudomesenteroides]YP_010083072.1 DNA adenine methylase [Leuconostoc phage phiMH1]ADP69210.1 putative methylase [Leuconostoc phage phiMH1]MDG9733468.1 DNA adenine methylase [Leuconostoc pseudomesenteroides]NKZ36091.1 hypothetical protein [Leuconostoc pseudomesenteroides]QQB26737.1 DNA adenine methylase [Leuconostoc pseudomesenteroides]
MNLTLDEKKIRKGKAVGLPYVGSKKKISKKIVEIIKQNFGTDKTVYDVFGGGGAITAELMINGIDVVYNDLDKTITDMFNRVLHQDREWIKTLIVSRDEFFTIREKEIKTVDDELKLLVNSFGNNRKDYLYGKKLSDIKYKVAVEILEREDVLFSYKNTTTYQKSAYKKIDKNDRIQQLENIQALNDNFSNYSKTKTYIDKVFNNEEVFRKCINNRTGRKIIHPIQQINSLTSVANVQKLNGYPKTSSKDYHFFSNIRDSILYLDPPYENTENGSYKAQIDYRDFYDWAVEMSKNNIVLLSSYEVSDDRFECVYEFKTARSTFQKGGYGSRCEKLFMVKS